MKLEKRINKNSRVHSLKISTPKPSRSLKRRNPEFYYDRKYFE